MFVTAWADTAKHGPKSPSFLRAMLMVLPWILFLGPYVSFTYREHVHKPYIHTPLVHFFRGRPDSGAPSQESATCPSAADAIEDSTIFQDMPYLEPGSVVEVMYELDTDDERHSFWYKANVISARADGTFHIKYAMYEDDEDVGLDRIRPYRTLQEQELVEILDDGMYHFAKIQRAHKDGTFDVYVKYYDEVLEDVSASMIRRFKAKHRSTFKLKPNTSMLQYLNPRLLENPKTFQRIGERLQNGELVVIRDAFIPEFAEAMHQDLYETENWKLHEFYGDDGFHYSHHNVYDEKDLSELQNATFEMFNHADTKRFIQNVTRRDCSGKIEASPSYYMPGDYSMPHSDFKNERTVAFVWHLTKNWQAEWGGALYWAPEQSYNAFQHASYNTLVLFVVNPTTMHFVTGVTPYAMDKRLTFNGWWASNFKLEVDDPVEELYATPEQRYDISRDLYNWILDIDLEQLPEERREKVANLQKQLFLMEYPENTQIHVVDTGEMRE